MKIAADYATLVTDAGARSRIYDAIQSEYGRATEAVGFLTGQTRIAERFPKFRDRFNGLRTDLDHIQRLQVALLRENRSAGNRALSVPLLQSMNSIAAGLGWTG